MSNFFSSKSRYDNLLYNMFIRFALVIWLVRVSVFKNNLYVVPFFFPRISHKFPFFKGRASENFKL